MHFSVECVFSHLGKCRDASRKSALCVDGLTEKRILGHRLTYSGPTSHGKTHSSEAFAAAIGYSTLR